MCAKQGEMRLYDDEAQRLYLNAAELRRFIAVANRAPPHIRRFALTLAYTGLRLSEARTLRYGSFQLEARVLSVQSLKKRRLGVVREVPISLALKAAFDALNQPEDAFIWPSGKQPIPRSTAYRWIKRLMIEAGITGPRACPRGLRHAYGVAAVMAGVPLHMLQRWMGHARMETTAIYATVLGPEQLVVADRMWR